MLSQIAESLYSDFPDELLYHYTTINGLRGIIKSHCLWASDVRYMNDSAELQYIVRLLRQRADVYQRGRAFLDLFVDWIANRITNGHMIFAASFRANGNLLSQWRGYSQIGKGVSIGIKGKTLLTLATQSNFQLGRCIYEEDRQIALIDRVLDSLLNMINDYRDIDAESGYENFFSVIEADMLRIAALLKHPSFAEEDEWRIVSAVVTDYLSSPVNFREGTSMLIPYYEFPLLCGDKKIPIDHLYIGPTPNSSLSLNSMRLYLRNHGIEPIQGISYCNIPYRNR
jgi:hypothetical protein